VPAHLVSSINGQHLLVAPQLHLSAVHSLGVSSGWSAVTPR
jgi:hypothetical protein